MYQVILPGKPATFIILICVIMMLTMLSRYDMYQTLGFMIIIIISLKNRKSSKLITAFLSGTL